MTKMAQILFPFVTQKERLCLAKASSSHDDGGLAGGVLAAVLRFTVLWAFVVLSALSFGRPEFSIPTRAHNF